MARLSSKGRERLSRPYFLELGKMVYAWNILHDQLGLIFAAVLVDSSRVGIDVWHCIPSDRTQRQMLCAAVGENVDPRQRKLELEKAKEILWLVDCTNKLADNRNTAIHSSYTFHYSGEDNQTRFVPNSSFGNPRALKLKDKDLLKELRWYRRRLTFSPSTPSIFGQLSTFLSHGPKDLLCQLWGREKAVEIGPVNLAKNDVFPRLDHLWRDFGNLVGSANYNTRNIIIVPP